jgi:SOS-response transcriptional repressor LexA
MLTLRSTVSLFSDLLPKAFVVTDHNLSTLEIYMQPENDIKFIFSDLLNDLINNYGLKVKHIAAHLRITPTHLSRLKSGKKDVMAHHYEALKKLHEEHVAKLAPLKPPHDRLEPKTRPFQMIPVISWARAGQASSFHDLENQIDEKMESGVLDPNAFALIIEGDSMEPEFRAGDRVVFSPNNEPRNGDFVVARLAEDGGVMFKVFHQTGPNGQIIQLKSLNPNYQTIEYKREEFRFIYPAIEFKRFLRKGRF